MDSNNLVTLQKAIDTLGVSKSFINGLIRSGKIKKYKVNSVVFISLKEFGELACADLK